MSKLCDLGVINYTDREDLVDDLYIWHRKWCGCDENTILDDKINELLKGKSDEFIDGFNECLNFFDQELFEDLMEQIDPEYGN